MPRLTKRIVDAAVKQDKDSYLWDDELTGFGVKITPAGKKVFLIQYRVGGAKGRTRRVTLGHLGPVTCDEARTRAKELLGMVKTGKDPAEERDRRKAEKTFGETITSFEKAHVDLKTKDRTAEEYKRALKLHVPDKLRRRPIGDIGRADMEQLHQDLEQNPNHGEQGHRDPVEAIQLGWRRRGFAPGENPCRYVERYDEVKRERFLSPDELGNLGKALAADDRQYVVAAIRLLLFTGARVNEILTAEWSWVDLAKGTIRLPDSKTGRKTLHLNAPALEVLNGLPKVKDNPFVIVGDVEKAHLVNIQKPWRAIRKAAGLDDVRLHDLRHTFASVGVEGGASLVMVGALLGHTQPQTTKRYAHLANDPQRVAADAIATRIADRLSPKLKPAPGERSWDNRRSYSAGSIAMDVDDLRKRESLIAAVEAGRLTPSDAEQQSLEAGSGPLLPPDRPEDFNPSTQERWTLLMAVVWVLARNITAVRNSWNDFIVSQYRWVPTVPVPMSISTSFRPERRKPPMVESASARS